MPKPKPGENPQSHDRSIDGDTSRDKPNDTGLTRRSLLAAGAAGFLASTASPADAGFLKNRRAARSRRKSSMTHAKQQAIVNYQTSLAKFGGRLSSPLSHLMNARQSDRPYDLDIAVIGSGYGGGITAARLAQQMRPGVRLAVMERGREWVPGTFKDTFRGGLRESRNKMIGRAKGNVSRPLGLLDYSQNGDVGVVTAAALGGTSLINANVVLKPDREVFQQSEWPVALRHREVLDPFYDASAVELGVAPGLIDSSPKMIAQRRAAARLAVRDKQHFAANLAVTFDGRYLDSTGRNRQGMIQTNCTLCGDCLSGCNVGAKNTVQMNYLPLARAHGAEIYTEVECRSVEKCDGYYRLHLVGYHSHNGVVQQMRFTKTARVVVLAGGSLGSTSILLRSQQSGLELSPALGSHWTGNGDALGFILETRDFTNGAGYGAYPHNGPVAGLAIQTITRLYGHGELSKRILIQDGNMPRAFANVIGTLMRDVTFDNTMVVFGMGHDGNKGRIVLQNGNPIIQWPGHENSNYRRYITNHFRVMARAHNGRYKALGLFGDKGISVHPLGGCNMSDDPLYGVVNDRGQVFDGRFNGAVDSSSGEAMVHDGLYVADGSIMSTSLGANPFWTISALSERIAASIAVDESHRDLFGSA